MPTEIDGAVELREALSVFTPDLARNLEKQLDRELAPIVQKARGYVPNSATMSNWAAYSASRKGRFPFYNTLEAKAGIKYTTTPSKTNRKGFSYAARVINRSVTGAIVETAGRKRPYGRKQDPYFGDRQAQLAAKEAGVPRKINKRYSQSANPNAGRMFINSLGALYDAGGKRKRGRRSKKMKGRLIYRAWSENEGKVNGAVNTAIDTTIQEFHKRTRGVFTSKTKKAA